MPAKNSTKYIFVAGGVLSGLGKGIASASIALLLKSRGYKVTAVKIDPYVSIDAGTMRPAEHGETFVTADGGEIDEDIGHYERFIDISLTKANNITTGKVYQAVIDKERHFFYQGRDAEVIPDVINQIKEMIYEPSKGFDFCVVEIGGTTGDLENQVFLHAAREIGKEAKAVYIMVTYLPFLRNVGELKTKPTQHAVSRLREIGIVPDFIITRNEIPIDKPRIESIAKRCFINEENIIDDPDLDLVYEVPLEFEEAKLAEKILSKFGLSDGQEKDLKGWRQFVENIKNPKGEVSIALVGKYVMHGAKEHHDVYISVVEALRHAGAYHKTKVNITPISSEGFENQDPAVLKNFDGIIVPQGWGSRGVEGMIKAVEFARANKIPYLGLCFGMQMATIEFARNVCNLKNANSIEVDPKTNHPVIHIMPEQEEYLAKHQYGGTIRLGHWPCKIKEGSLLEKCYKDFGTFPSTTLQATTYNLVHERHRHRYELNNEYRNRLEKTGLVISGTSPDGKLVEAIELPEATHPFFLGTQFHPEYQSHPLSPHPIFCAFIKAARSGKTDP